MSDANEDSAERLTRIAGEAARYVIAWRRLRAQRAAGVISEAEYQEALAELERWSGLIPRGRGDGGPGDPPSG
jgi:hypothetical protein